jgi:hypothetical protein
MRNPDRAAAGDAEIVADFLGLVGFAVGRRVERAILVIPEQAAVIVVRAALGDRSDRARLAEFGVVTHAIDAKFRDRFRRGPRIGERIVAAGVLRRDAVDRSFGHERQTALHGIFSIAVGLHARQRRDEFQRACAAVGAIVRREFEDVTRIEAGGDRRSFGVDRGRDVVHFDNFGARADGEHEFLADFLAGE